MSDRQLKLKVMCSQLPGLRFEDPHKHEPRVKEPVYLGIQRGTEVIDQVPADRHRVVFHPEFKIGKKPDGSPNFLGPFAQGRPMDRFFYLSWGVRRSDRFEMFRRLKIRLTNLEWPEIDRALESDDPIVVKLKLTDGGGGPLCGTPDSSRIAWER
jgi:hypothetical protein